MKRQLFALSLLSVLALGMAQPATAAAKTSFWQRSALFASATALGSIAFEASRNLMHNFTEAGRLGYLSNMAIENFSQGCGITAGLATIASIMGYKAATGTESKNPLKYILPTAGIAAGTALASFCVSTLTQIPDWTIPAQITGYSVAALGAILAAYSGKHVVQNLKAEN